MTDLGKLLRRLGACDEAVTWANGKELAEAWAICERPDWMLWLCGKMEGKEGWPTRQQIVLVACRFAEDVLPIFEKKYPEDDRPRKAIETARKWANGEATIEEVHRAKAATYAAYAVAAYAYAYAAAAYAAAYAAAATYAAYAAAATTTAATYATAAAAYAAAAATDAAAAAAYALRFRKQKEYADIIRQELKIPVEVKP